MLGKGRWKAGSSAREQASHSVNLTCMIIASIWAIALYLNICFQEPLIPAP